MWKVEDGHRDKTEQCVCVRVCGVCMCACVSSVCVVCCVCVLCVCVCVCVRVKYKTMCKHIPESWQRTTEAYHPIAFVLKAESTCSVLPPGISSSSSA